MIRSLLLLVLPALAVAAEPAVDWTRAGAEAVEHFLALLRIDTSNPPGNETAAAQYVQKTLAREGIPSKLLALEPSRANLVARLKGNGSKRPLLLMGHTDVVGVQREKWTVDPFGGIRKGGFIYGRGSLDDKDNLTAAMMVLILLKRHNVALDRDVILLAEAGEESTTRVGIDFMVDRHWSEIDAEYALAEGGSAVMRDGKVRYMTVSTSEKIPRPVRLIARGLASHASRPSPENAVVRLAQAVARVGAWQPPIRLNDTTRTYFERLATISAPEAARRYTRIVDPAEQPAIDRYFAQHEWLHYSMLRTSIVPTVIRAGFRTNVIPSEAEATLDVRALPDEDMEKLLAEIRRVVNDPNVEVAGPTARGRPASRPSRHDSEMFRALEAVQRRLYPGTITLPAMQAGATDMAQLRAKGVEAYGIGPPVIENDRHGSHGDDERIPEGSLEKLLELTWRATVAVAAKP